MSDQALILHLANGAEPVVFALSDKSAKSLLPRLPVLRQPEAGDRFRGLSRG